MSSSPERPDNFTRNDGGNGPGQYDDRSYEFGKTTKSFTIGEKRETRIADGVGPGAYSPERADSQMKTRNPNIDFRHSPERPDNFTRVGEG